MEARTSPFMPGLLFRPRGLLGASPAPQECSQPSPNLLMGELMRETNAARGARALRRAASAPPLTGLPLTRAPPLSASPTRGRAKAAGRIPAGPGAGSTAGAGGDRRGPTGGRAPRLPRRPPSAAAAPPQLGRAALQDGGGSRARSGAARGGAAAAAAPIAAGGSAAAPQPRGGGEALGEHPEGAEQQAQDPAEEPAGREQQPGAAGRRGGLWWELLPLGGGVAVRFGAASSRLCRDRGEPRLLLPGFVTAGGGPALHPL